MRIRTLLPVALVAGVAATTAVCGVAVAAGGGSTAYNPGTPVVDGIANGPWNTSQGDPAAGTMVPLANLFPTWLPTGSAPNLAVYPAASGATPYPSGVAGTPGPLAGYCAAGYPNNENSSPVGQPLNINQPFAPYYFPDIVRNADGSLTGYFDWRPKDADEAIVVAKSTDNGATWQAEGKALDQNGSYCPTADTNDDGQGHPYVMSVGGTTRLYTLQRPAGDYPGVGLLTHPVNPSASNPLASVPANPAGGHRPQHLRGVAAGHRADERRHRDPGPARWAAPARPCRSSPARMRTSRCLRRRPR